MVVNLLNTMKVVAAFIGARSPSRCSAEFPWFVSLRPSSPPALSSVSPFQTSALPATVTTRQHYIHLHCTATLRPPCLKKIKKNKTSEHRPSCQLPVLFDQSQMTAAVWSSPPLPGSAGSPTASLQCLHSVSTSMHLVSPHTARWLHLI